MSRAEVAAQESSYRRGLLLGFTMAEMVLLIIFALLLAMGTALYHKEGRMKKAEQARDAADLALAEIRVAAQRVGYEPARIEELFRELKRGAQDREKLKELQASLVEAERNASYVKELVAAVSPKSAINAGESFEKVVQEADKQRRAAEALDQIAATIYPDREPPRAGIEQSEIVETAREIASVARDAEQRIATLRGQNRALLNKLGGPGKGTEMPPCWAVEATGRPEYIFDVTLTSLGLVVKDNALPHRANEQAKLPLSGIGFGLELSTAQFLEQMLPLYEWSKREECRFFVRVADATGTSEKARYKELLRAVEARFYKFEPAR